MLGLFFRKSRLELKNVVLTSVPNRLQTKTQQFVEHVEVNITNDDGTFNSTISKKTSPKKPISTQRCQTCSCC